MILLFKFVVLVLVYILSFLQFISKKLVDECDLLSYIYWLCIRIKILAFTSVLVGV